MQTCYKFETTKPLTEFYTSKRDSSGYEKKYKECRRAETKQYREDAAAAKKIAPLKFPKGTTHFVNGAPYKKNGVKGFNYIHVNGDWIKTDIHPSRLNNRNQVFVRQQ